MKSSNPVLSRLEEAAQRERAAGYSPAPQYGQGYPAPDVFSTAPTVAPMTMDDVVVRTVGLLAVLGIAAAAAWKVVPDSLLVPVWIGAAMVGLVLGLVISFARITNPAVILAYTVVEGVFVGLVSKLSNDGRILGGYDGVVTQAAAGTFGVFFIMAALYKFRVIRATPKFVKGMIAAVAGVFALMLVNFVLSFFGIQTHLRDGSRWSIIFSIVCIVIAALTFILDFDQIETGVRMGLPRKYAWSCAFGILVGLIWLYLEILRLLRTLNR